MVVTPPCIPIYFGTLACAVWCVIQQQRRLRKTVFVLLFSLRPSHSQQHHSSHVVPRGVRGAVSMKRAKSAAEHSRGRREMGGVWGQRGRTRAVLCDVVLEKMAVKCTDLARRGSM